MSLGKLVGGVVLTAVTVKVISVLMESSPEAKVIKEKIEKEHSRRKEADKDICKVIINLLHKKNPISNPVVLGL